MVDKTFSVTVTTSKPKGITVKSAVSQNEITAKGDTSLYYSQLAKKWATSPDLVQGIDYSAKMYAQTAKDYAEQGKGYLDSAVIVYNDFDNQSSLTLREIATVKNESLEEFNVALNEGKDVALGAISDEKTVALNAIENEKDVAIQEIDDAFAELGEDLSDVKIVADNIETVQTIGENVENILNKTVEVGDTLTSEAGTEAKVVNVGTKFAPVLEFTIPQGAKGVDGKDGANGGMNAEFDSETATLSFSAPVGVALYPEWGYVQGDINNQVDLKTVLDDKQDKGDYALKSDIPNASNLVHKDGTETITGAKTFTSAVNLIGSGDSNAVGISTNTRFNVHNTNKTVLGFGSNLFYINHGDYRLRLRGKDTRPHYNSDTNYLALLSDIPDLTDYVKNTDYATSDVGGVIKQSTTYGFSVNASTGIPFASTKGLAGYQNSDGNMFIGKNTLENIKDDLVRRGVTANTIELSADEKASAKQWLGYADSTDIMTAIASIPQFSLSIVDELPLAGEKMTLYLVPKEGTNNDVYDEYIWIEQTSSFEHLGTTAVDLADYVKKTDYITGSTAGVVRAGAYYGTTAFNGFLCCQTRTQEQYDAHDNTTVIGKGTLENIKNDVVKRAITTNTIELTDDEKSSARTWLGAISNTDYAGATSGAAGVVKCSSTFACGCTNGYIQTTYIPTIERYNNLSQYAFIGKGTLQTALTEYSKTVLTTEADYNALETKDANTLYLIEE